MSVQSTILNRKFCYNTLVISILYNDILCSFTVLPVQTISLGLCFLIYRMIGADNMNF